MRCFIIHFSRLSRSIENTLSVAWEESFNSRFTKDSHSCRTRRPRTAGGRIIDEGHDRLAVDKNAAAIRGTETSYRGLVLENSMFFSRKKRRRRARERSIMTIPTCRETSLVVNLEYSVYTADKVLEMRILQNRRQCFNNSYMVTQWQSQKRILIKRIFKYDGCIYFLKILSELLFSQMIIYILQFYIRLQR